LFDEIGSYVVMLIGCAIIGFIGALLLHPFLTP
jgi:hypothetical protein